MRKGYKIGFKNKNTESIQRTLQASVEKGYERTFGIKDKDGKVFIRGELVYINFNNNTAILVEDTDVNKFDESLIEYLSNNQLVLESIILATTEFMNKGPVNYSYELRFNL